MRGAMVLAVITTAAVAALSGAGRQAERIRLEELDLTKMSAGWGTPLAGRSCEGKPLTLGGKVYAHGVGTHAPSEMLIDLKGGARTFEATVGLDDERPGQGSITFEVWVDDLLAAQTPVMHGGDPPRVLSVDLRGKSRLALIATDGGDDMNHDHADWADACLTLSPGAAARPEAATMPSEPAPRIHSGNRPEPAIHGPRIMGATPGKPFIYRIPATGTGPLTFEARGLPAGLRLDRTAGIVAGSIARPGRYAVHLTARGPRGVGRRTVTLVAGKGKLALTPPMGWNSWYVWFDSVSQKKMEDAADALVRSGLAAHGYQYVNIDDCWAGTRDASGAIRGNERFPDMKSLGDHIHALGLRFGIYTSPGPRTCANYEGSWQHEEQDARTYASWGVDFLKHDWCSYGSVAKDGSLPELKKPYRLMADAIERTDRDIVYNLCQYGMGDVWKWGGEVGAHCWRTTGDSGDTWSAISAIGFGQAGLERWAGPGRWNDPDYLQLGMLGGAKTRPTRLTPNEQITQVTLWSLVAAPLVLSCDLTQLDRFSLDLLTNDEVIDVDQDPLGKAAGRVFQEGRAEVWARPLSDGSRAVGLFNRGVFVRKVRVNWTQIGLKGGLRVRDLWQQRELGRFSGGFEAEVPAHGAALVRVRR